MNTSKCLVCGHKTKRHGKTSGGLQRWQCMSCKATFTHKIKNNAKLFTQFLSWLMSRKRQADMPGDGRTFRRKTAKFWAYWAMPPRIDEIHHVVYVDGIYLGRLVVVLIARTDKYVLGWYVAKSENSKAYASLMSRIPPPDVVVSDGGSGFEKARRRVWPKTRTQRCLFHVFNQVKRYTTTRPRLQAGVELYAIAKALLRICSLKQAQKWIDSYFEWCKNWDEFLSEITIVDGKKTFTHERLVKAKKSLNIIINKKTLFTYLDHTLSKDGPIPHTNNLLEGGTNAQIRHVIRDHRGLDIKKRIKVVYWWCYMHTKCPLAPAKLLSVMPTDEDISKLYLAIDEKERLRKSIHRWGDAMVWHELHSAPPYRMDWD
jgi:hypothetical protein